MKKTERVSRESLARFRGAISAEDLEDGEVRQIHALHGRKWVAVSGRIGPAGYTEVTLHEIVPESEYAGVTQDYQEAVARQTADRGLYPGLRVYHAGKRWVLTEAELTLTAEE